MENLVGGGMVHSSLKHGKANRFTLKSICETPLLGRRGRERDPIQHSGGGRK